MTTGVQELDAHDLAETSASVSARATRKLEARRALVERVMLLGKTADVLHGVDAGFKAHFKLPASVNDQALLTAARQVAKQVTPVAAQFVAHGMPATFPSDFDALIEQFEGAVRDRGMNRGEQLAARARIQASLKNALAAVRRLDVIVANHLASDSAAREVWKRSRRIDYPHRGRKAAAPPGDAPVAPAPGPTPAAGA